MVTAYIRAAVQRDHHRLIEDSTSVGTIPGLQGVVANDNTLEVCWDKLQSALED